MIPKDSPWGQALKNQRLESKINRAKYFIVLVSILSIAAYTGWFYVINDQVLSDRTEDWGYFGSFIGGILNPLIAYFAFYWFTQSVIIQKHELNETKQSLENNNIEQKRIAEINLSSLRIQAINLELEALNNKINSQSTVRYQFTKWKNEGRKDLFNEDGQKESASSAISRINNEIKEMVNTRDTLFNDLKTIVKETNSRETDQKQSTQ